MCGGHRDHTSALRVRIPGALPVRLDARTRQVAIVLLTVDQNGQLYADVPSADTILEQFSPAPESVGARLEGLVNFSFDANLDGQADVFGPVPVVIQASTACGYREWSDAAISLLEAQGISLLGYDHVLFVLPDSLSEPCGNYSWGDFSAPSVWLVDYSSYIIAHELGHNLGLNHASADLDNDTEPDADGEYGDPYSVMGSGTYLSTTDRFMLGGINPEHIVFLLKRGLYDVILAPAGQNPGAGEFSVARVLPQLLTGPLMISMERGETMVHVSREMGFSAHSLFLKELAPGESFFDGQTGVTVSVLAISGKAQIQISVPDVDSDSDIKLDSIDKDDDSDGVADTLDCSPAAYWDTRRIKGSSSELSRGCASPGTIIQRMNRAIGSFTKASSPKNSINSIIAAHNQLHQLVSALQRNQITDEAEAFDTSSVRLENALRQLKNAIRKGKIARSISRPKRDALAELTKMRTFFGRFPGHQWKPNTM